MRSCSALTFEHGRHLGLVKGGIGRRARPLLQPGNRLELIWKARLAEHLGHFTRRADAAVRRRLLDDPLRLAALAAPRPCSRQALAEREPHPRLYAALLDAAGGACWPIRAGAETYVRFELLLLQELGFALDLASCAVTGATDDLAYVSPRTGRAVSRGCRGRARAAAAAAAAVPRGRRSCYVRPTSRAGLRLSGPFPRQAPVRRRPTAPCPPPASACWRCSAATDETDRMSRTATPPTDPARHAQGRAERALSRLRAVDDHLALAARRARRAEAGAAPHPLRDAGSCGSTRPAASRNARASSAT